MKTDTLVAFRISNEDHAKVKAIAVKLDRSASWVMRDALKAYIAKAK